MSKTIEMHAVESSQIHSIGHDATTNTLAIRFKSFKGEATSLYHYDNFTAADFEAFRGAESIGKHFGQYIKPEAVKHPYRKVDETAAQSATTATAKGITTPRFDTSVAGLTTDNTTGLTWTRAHITEDEVSFVDAQAAIAKLNDEGYLGFFDWRLPTSHELFGIVDHGRFAPAIDTDSFECGKYDWTWTGTCVASSSGSVWGVYFLYGSVSYLNRGHHDAFVRAVRGGASPSGQ